MSDTRSIDLESLKVLQDKVIFPTSNDKHVLAQELEIVVREPEYKLLGFLNNYSYSAASGYLAKANLKGNRIAEILLDVDHGYFFEKLNIMYFTKDKILYCIDENLNVLWQKEFDDYIRSVTIDIYGSCYILFQNSRLILKYLKSGKEVLYLLDSEDVAKEQRLYKSFITPGSGYMYVIGSSFYGYNKVISFIDYYDTRKGEIIEHQILSQAKNVKVDDPYYEYYDIRQYGDYICIYGKQFIEKINLKMIPIWKFNLGYNSISRLPNDIAYIEYDDSKYDEKIYFAEDLYDTNGHSIGLLSPNGKMIWNLKNEESSKESEFRMCVYQGNIYTTTLQDINCHKSYLLSINDNTMYLKTHDGYLVQVKEKNCDEMFIPENYFGQRLIGDKIKEGIEKFLKVPIMHDSGPIIVDDDNLLFAQIENDDYTNPNNYNYFYLLSSERLSNPGNTTILTTKNGSTLVSYFNSAFKTKEPYFDYSSYDMIANDVMDNLETTDEKNIIKKSAYYSRNRYLLADRFKFRMAICTKKNILPIATKKHHFLIARKKRYVYKYILKKLSDIDIIVEFLEQNGILDTLIPYYVDKLRHHTTHMIEDMQAAGAPNIYDIQAVKKFSYKYDAYEFPIRTSNTQIYMLKNMPYNKKRDFKSIFIDSMANLVINKEIRPFLLFIGGRVIKWSDIVIIRDWFYTYAVIKNIQETNYTVNAIIFPCTIRYGEDNQILPDCKAHMYFNEDGYITENKDDVAIRIEVIDPNVTGETFELSVNKNYFQLSTNEDQITFNRNIIAFEDNKLFVDSRFYLQSFGKNAYKYIRDTDTILKTFYYNKANNSKNLLLTPLNQDQINIDAVNRSKETAGSETNYMDNFHRQFDFKMSRDKTYARNVAEATRYILTYNMQLLINYYKDRANFKSYNYTGEELYKLTPEQGGYLYIPRQRRHGLDDFVIVFHNDQLYHYYKEIKYENRFFKIPIFNHVKREDKVEILHFKNIDNTYYSLTVTKDKPDYIAKFLRHDNFLLFGNSYSGKPVYDEFNVENNIQYELSFDYKNNWNGNKYVSTEIKLDDEYYYGKRINIVAKRQFHYMYYHVLEDKNVFYLNPDFRFCRNKNQYLVFVDGIKLNNDDFSLQYMTNENQITRMSITTVDMVKKNSYIYFIYIPDAYNELLIDNYESEISNGDINLDTSELEYPFDKDLFLISIDGKKILNSNIQNIDSHRVKLTHMDGPFKQICINSFMKPDALLKEVFSYGDTWSRAVDSLSKEDYIKLFKKIKK